jgi:hypothetical protein
MMPRIPRPFTGQNAWWVDALASILALGVAQGVVVGATAFINGGSRGGASDRPTAADTALVLQRPGGSDGVTGFTPLTVSLEGSVEGLYPGASVGLPIEVRNPTEATLRLDVLEVRVGQPDREGCPASALLIGPDRIPGGTDLPVSLMIEPGTDETVSVAVTMATDADSACQGAVFPLDYFAQGELP